MPGSLPNFDHIADANKKVQPAPSLTPENPSGGPWPSFVSEIQQFPPQPAPLPEFASFVALADKAADNAFEVIAQLRAHISDLTRRLAEVEAECVDRAASQADLAHQLNTVEHERVVPLAKKLESAEAERDALRIEVKAADAACRFMEAQRDALRERCDDLESDANCERIKRKCAEGRTQEMKMAIARYLAEKKWPGSDRRAESAALASLHALPSTEGKP